MTNAVFLYLKKHCLFKSLHSDVQKHKVQCYTRQQNMGVKGNSARHTTLLKWTDQKYNHQNYIHGQINLGIDKSKASYIQAACYVHPIAMWDTVTG